MTQDSDSSDNADLSLHVEPRIDKIVAALRRKAGVLRARITQNQRELSAVDAAISALDGGNRQRKGVSTRVREIVRDLQKDEFTIKDIGDVIDPELKHPAYTSTVASVLKRMQSERIIELVGRVPGKGKGRINIWRKIKLPDP